MLASQSHTDRLAGLVHRFVLLLMCIAVTPIARGQEKPSQLGAAESLFPEIAKQVPADEVQPLTDEQLQQMEELIEGLGSKQFAARERAASDLLDLGKAVIPRLRSVGDEAEDPEVRVRANEIVSRLTRGDMETRIEDFMLGKDVNFAGWRVTRAMLGESLAIRELFIEIMLAHPDLTASLDGMTRDRAIAMEKVVTKIQHGMFIERKFPTRADAFALLLPTADRNVPLNAGFENLLLSVLQKEAASKIYRDAQLAVPFKRLMGEWMIRSTLSSREEVLLTGMRWGIDRALPLALQTLGEANQSEVLGIALQAIARFGTREQIEAVVPLLDDARPASEVGFAEGEAVRTHVGDVAMATIAALYEVPLEEVGFAGAKPHPTYAFIVKDLGFPLNDNAPRKAARGKIDNLLANPPQR